MTFHGVKLFIVLTVIRKDTTKMKWQDFTGDRYWLEIIGEGRTFQSLFPVFSKYTLTGQDEN